VDSAVSFVAFVAVAATFVAPTINTIAEILAI